jgi:predicted dehydrogenase
LGTRRAIAATFPLPFSPPPFILTSALNPFSQGDFTMTTRREFLKTTAVATGALALASNVHAAGSDMIKVGLVGCGGRGTGAAHNVLSSAKGVSIVAMGDAFQDRLEGCRKYLQDLGKDKNIKDAGNTVELPADRCFVGLDAYDRVINSKEVNYVILATPPGFRPQHIQATVAAGKNLFTEKPVGVDGAGIRKVLQAYEDSQKKGLYIAAGTQRRHQAPYIQTVARLQEGAIGDILTGRCHWNQGNIWFKKRKAGMTDVEYQLYNWYHFMWTCGDHIVEQHVHNLDVINWVLKGHPTKCSGMGGRTRAYKDPNEDGNIFNFFSVDYEYPNGVHIQSTCRQIDQADGGLDGGVSEVVVGTKGTCHVNTFTIDGKSVAGRGGVDPYVQEHTDLIACIRASKPINELKNVAESTLTAILGRMSCYTGKNVTWEQALNTKEDTFPAKLTMDMSLPAAPVPVPGTTKLI